MVQTVLSGGQAVWIDAKANRLISVRNWSRLRPDWQNWDRAKAPA